MKTETPCYLLLNQQIHTYIYHKRSLLGIDNKVAEDTHSKPSESGSVFLETFIQCQKKIKRKALFLMNLKMISMYKQNYNLCLFENTR